MDARDAARLIEFLEQHGLEVYVDGGWAVDALLGEQSRPHGDLDIAVPHKYVPALRELLAGRGYCEQRRDDAWECNFVLADALGREVDVHSYTLDDAGSNVYGVAYVSEHLTGRGSIDGYPVRCISPEWLCESTPQWSAESRPASAHLSPPRRRPSPPPSASNTIAMYGRETPISRANCVMLPTCCARVRSASITDRSFMLSVVRESDRQGPASSNHNGYVALSFWFLSDPPNGPIDGTQRGEPWGAAWRFDPGYRQAGCWHSQRSSVRCPASLQCSLQYLPYGPPGSTTHWQLG